MIIKEQLIEKNKKNRSNAPISDEEAYGGYADLLDEKIKDTNVYNIGIIGPYGSGKSSLIKTYIEKKLVEKKDKEKVITISLANFNSSSSEIEDIASTKNNKTVRDIDCEIEKSILQQFIFNVEKDKLPYSHIERIHKKNLLFRQRIIFLIFLTLSFIMLSILKFSNELTTKYLEEIPLGIYCFLSIISFCMLLSNLLYQFNIKKIAIKNIETEISNSSNTSILNIFIDELIYFFAESKKSIVVIEDLDRFDNLDIFSKLREINFLLNNSNMLNKKITFIYLINDTVFKLSEERAKFFDYIITIITCVNHTNINKLMSECIDDDSKKLDNDYIHYICRYIDDLRILRNTISDYQLYYDKLNVKDFDDVNKNKKLFSIMLYKNTFPLKFVDLQKNEGEIVNLITAKRKYIIDLEDKIKHEILELEEKINKLDDKNIKSFDDLETSIIGIIIKMGNVLENKPQNSCDVSRLKDNDDTLKVHICIDGKYYFMSRSEIESILKNKISDIKKEINDKSNSMQITIKNKINEKKASLSKLKKITLKNFIDENYNISNIDNVDELTKFLIRMGYIDEDYKFYINVNSQNTNNSCFSDNDLKFIRKIFAKDKLSYDYKIDNPKLVIDELSNENLSSSNWHNFDLFECLMSSNNIEISITKKNSAINSLKVTQDESIEFWKSFIESNRNISLMTEKFIMEDQNMTSIILANPNIEQDLKDKYIVKLFIDNRKKINVIIKNQNINSCIKNYLLEHNKIIENIILKMPADLFIQYLNFFKIKIKKFHTTINLNDEIKEKLKIFVTNELYEINENNLYFIEFKLYDINFFINNAFLTNAMNDINAVKKYLLNNLNEYCKLVAQTDGTCNDDDIIIDKVLIEQQVDEKLKLSYIKKIVNPVNLNPRYSVKIIKYLIDNNKIIPNWKNVGIIYKTNENDVLFFVDKNYEKLSIETLSNTDLINYLCINAKDYYSFEMYSKSFTKNFNYDMYSDKIESILLINEKIIPSILKFRRYCNNGWVESATISIKLNPELINDFYGFNNNFISDMINTMTEKGINIDLIYKFISKIINRDFLIKENVIPIIANYLLNDRFYKRPLIKNDTLLSNIIMCKSNLDYKTRHNILLLYSRDMKYENYLELSNFLEREKYYEKYQKVS